jgi:hypothetical protein
MHHRLNFKSGKTDSTGGSLSFSQMSFTRVGYFPSVLVKIVKEDNCTEPFPSVRTPCINSILTSSD